MDLQAEKKKIIKELEHTNEDWVIRSIKRLLSIDQEVVEYHFDGSVLTKDQLIEEIMEASSQVKSGNYISQEEAEKEIDSW
ncbi:MAG: hypothetical protein SFW35_03350 [Chitinophagales bacterium]|nr:hypothetical protein [Chitinophagales bacterium]